ncbi:alcohol dehydrogenase, class IV [Schinkia azotoformans MEV2011]|uniref:Alcohol dehydrogenase, class IV n=1 Tax=Schinkia azotoformans MEV2011 TaxID=1348973 RepID=A0A072NNQ4_SCHAZ|nr:iron-containing alcohol dehydrogenase [Schinkia azotoformans]KEF39299.1 alcohol dehydrogenase, class IV [Schinkia azotoformans MEV2011]MEC1694948.1 iron-containing alcohol dehydrogenase [Schinkia azotoformans]MEC1725559.1 iron-containing alcohol dehydrogenase [Schinkia azotoformans]MEC1739934.1 iron-containing alcohol dehydrogenase [Schinkia azotoformans]MEC1747726.1 iron-containing alcohol dehydrogenase [Schinkia azotoformans]
MGIKKFVTPEIIFGIGSIDQVGESCLRLGAKKALIVSDEGVVEAGWMEKVINNCRAVGLEYATFFNITMNPKDFEIECGREFYLHNECDSVIGIGGGSALDVAKAIAILATNGGHISDYEGVDQIKIPLPPMVMVSTTAGSGSEVSQFSVIVDTTRQKKMTIISKSLVPDIAIIDPNTLITKNHSLTASTGLDVLTHGIEAYVSVAATPLTDVQAKNAISLVSKYLRPSVASKTNIEAKKAMAMASLQAGLAFSNAILGAAHAMSHAIGGRFPFSHGDVNAILLPYVMEFNFIATPKRFADIAELMGIDVRGMELSEAGRKAVEQVRLLSLEIGAPQRLSDMGLKGESIQEMGKIALEDACMITNPRDVMLKDVEQLFRQAL